MEDSIEKRTKRIKNAVLYLISKEIISEKSSQKDIAQKMGAKNSTNTNYALNGDKRYLTDSFLKRFNNAFGEIFSIDWLLSGDGEMLITSNIVKKEGILTRTEQIPTDSTYKLVPVIHIDSVGGMRSNNNIVGEPQYIEGYVPFVNAKDDDRAIYQSGNSMIPTVPPGSLMQIREVPKWREYFGYGNIFVIELTDGRRITKEINRYNENPKEYVWCHSHNPEVADEELPKSMIVSVWKVIKVLTDKGW